MVPNKNHPSKGPRLDKEDRLLKRFYEPLVLLHVLDPNGAQRISRHAVDMADAPHVELWELRRAFLDQLAYVCDYTKGGDTVTAIALEAQPSGVIYWITANSGVSPGTIRFLEQLLNTLQLSCQAGSDRNHIETQIAQMCIEFGRRRDRSYQKLIEPLLKRCIRHLSRSQKSSEILLRGWLKEFQDFKGKLSDLCHFAYQQRSSHCMMLLHKHIDEMPEMITGSDSKKQAFLLTRHYIGRLGSHPKAAKALVTASMRMPNLLDQFTIKKLPSPTPPSLPPLSDHLTTLNGILGRMLPKYSRDIARYQQDLAFMDMKFGLQERLDKVYNEKSFRPRVHAELNLLEHFYGNELSFFDDDRFIGCSKPACYCCYQYISQHPGDFVHPPSHGARYLNWHPPDLVNPGDERGKFHQRDILNKVIRKIRLDALRHIEQRRGRSHWHPDSTTGITFSVARERDRDKSGEGRGDSKIDNSQISISASSSLDRCSIPEARALLGDEAAGDLEEDSDGGVPLT